MKKCVSCGIDLDDDARFCGECGSKQPELKNVCGNCGAELPVGARFCGECGSPVSSQPSTPQQPQKMPQPLTPKDAEIAVRQPDDSTIALTVNGISFNLKLVRGRDYGTDKEIADFFIGETPVTQELWSLIMGDNPSRHNEDANYPVTNITPSSAISFLVALQKLTGVKFELPAEEQWKYAYHGGRKSKGYKFSGSDDITEIGWVDGVLHPVGQLFANELGLTDMEGNVEEMLKGNRWSSISINGNEKLNGSDLAGLRLAINIPVDEILGDSTPLKATISAYQAELLPARESEIQARRQREEELAREEALRKAAEEAARAKAEEEARIKAEEEARIKAEEEARRKAEEEARKQAEREAARIKAEEKARIKAEEEAKRKAEKEAKITSLKNEQSRLQAKDTELKNQYDAHGKILNEKKASLSKTEEAVNNYIERLALIEKSGAELEKRFNVVMTKRVDNGFLNTKGNKFDEVLTSLTGASKEEIKEWNSTLKRDKRVAISQCLDKEEALRYKSVIDNAGGEATVESSLSDTEYETQKNNLLLESSKIRGEQAAASKLIISLKDEIIASEKQHHEAEAAYIASHLKCDKCSLEINFIESGLSVNEFIKNTYANEAYRSALSELFGAEYESFVKKEEAARLKAEQEAKRKAEEEEKRRAEAEREAQMRLAEELRKKEEQAMKDKAKGLALYTPDDEVDKAYMTIFEKQIKDFNRNVESLLSAVENAIEEDEIEWQEYLTDFYWNKSVLQYAVVDDNILVVKGNGAIPDVEESKNSQGHGKWHINPEFEKIKLEVENLVITGNITKIGARCFADFLLQSVMMCDSIETIGEACFSNNENLENVKFPQNLKEIKEDAFRSTALRHAMLPGKVAKIGKNAFAECENLSTILVPKSAAIDKNAFKDCSNLG